MKLFEKEAIEGPTKIYEAKPTKHYLIATCMFKYKRTCEVKRCSFARCAGCIWSRISKKRISKSEMQRLKNMGEMFHACKSMPDTSDLVLVKVKEMKGGNHERNEITGSLSKS